MLTSPSLDSKTAHAHRFAACQGVSNRPGVSSCGGIFLHQPGTFITAGKSPTHAHFIYVDGMRAC